MTTLNDVTLDQVADCDSTMAYQEAEHLTVYNRLAGIVPPAPRGV